MSVREAQARISSSEFAEWVAFERLHGPLDIGRRIDLAAALVACVLANLHRDPKRRPYTVSDFLPRYDEPPAEKTPEQMLAIVELWNAALGGEDLRGQ